MGGGVEWSLSTENLLRYPKEFLVSTVSVFRVMTASKHGSDPMQEKRQLARKKDLTDRIMGT